MHANKLIIYACMSTIGCSITMRIYRQHNNYKNKSMHPAYKNENPCIKTHGSVSCGPRKRGARKQREYIYTKNKVGISRRS